MAVWGGENDRYWRCGREDGRWERGMLLPSACQNEKLQFTTTKNSLADKRASTCYCRFRNRSRPNRDRDQADVTHVTLRKHILGWTHTLTHRHKPLTKFVVNGLVAMIFWQPGSICNFATTNQLLIHTRKWKSFQEFERRAECKYDSPSLGWFSLFVYILLHILQCG